MSLQDSIPQVSEITVDTVMPGKSVIPADTAMPAKSVISVDTVMQVKPVEYAIVMENPEIRYNPVPGTESFGMSYIIGGMLILFAAIGFRFKSDRRYMSLLWHDLLDVRTRGNIFDATVRETSLLVLTNVLWSLSAGIVVWCLSRSGVMGTSWNVLTVPGDNAASIAVCMGVAIVYSIFMVMAYFTVGTVFADKPLATLWLKGHTAAMALLSFIFFPLSLLMIFYPQWNVELLYIALFSFILAKAAFILKGFRIFFNQVSSWVLFLYYLCSLEIVPLILTYAAAMYLCSILTA